MQCIPDLAYLVFQCCCRAEVVYLQQWQEGRLLGEEVLRVAQQDMRKKQEKKEGQKTGERARGGGGGVRPQAGGLRCHTNVCVLCSVGAFVTVTAGAARVRCLCSQAGGAAPLPGAQAGRAHLQGAPQLRPHAGAAAGHHIQHRPVWACEWAAPVDAMLNRPTVCQPGGTLVMAGCCRSGRHLVLLLLLCRMRSLGSCRSRILARRTPSIFPQVSLQAGASSMASN